MVVPILTEVIVLLALNPAPLKSTVEPRAALAIGWLEVLVRVTAGLSVNGWVTVTELSVMVRV